jgi:hypothetical protein
VCVAGMHARGTLPCAVAHPLRAVPFVHGHGSAHAGRAAMSAACPSHVVPLAQPACARTGVRRVGSGAGLHARGTPPCAAACPSRAVPFAHGQRLGAIGHGSAHAGRTTMSAACPSCAVPFAQPGVRARKRVGVRVAESVDREGER